MLRITKGHKEFSRTKEDLKDEADPMTCLYRFRTISLNIPRSWLVDSRGMNEVLGIASKSDAQSMHRVRWSCLLRNRARFTILDADYFRFEQHESSRPCSKFASSHRMGTTIQPHVSGVATCARLYLVEKTRWANFATWLEGNTGESLFYQLSLQQYGTVLLLGAS